MIAWVFGATAAKELPNDPLYALDDFVVSGVAIVLIALWVSRLRTTASARQPETAANESVALLVVAWAAKIFAAAAERNGPDDVGDEIPAIDILRVALGSRFV